MEYLAVLIVIGLAVWIWTSMYLIKKGQKKMFIGNQWHIPTPREGRENIEIRHEYLSELQWLAKRLPDRAFHTIYEDNTDQAVVYHRTSKEG